MATKAKAAEYASSFPHVKQVWVKDGEFYLHPVPGSELIHEAGEQIAEEVADEVKQQPIKKVKTKGNGN
jgi:hypothetical protein